MKSWQALRSRGVRSLQHQDARQGFVISCSREFISDAADPLEETGRLRLPLNISMKGIAGSLATRLGDMHHHSAGLLHQPRSSAFGARDMEGAGTTENSAAQMLQTRAFKSLGGCDCELPGPFLTTHILARPRIKTGPAGRHCKSFGIAKWKPSRSDPGKYADTRTSSL